jgi:tetratricopeptide (TPR) repeat protein
MKKQIRVIITLSLFIGNAVLNAQMRGISLPPDGGNQKSIAIQYIGLVEAKITYHSPNIIHPRTKENRKGNIWGKVIPYGTGKNDAVNIWRAGANANTLFSVSHDVLINGHKLPKGEYGLFMIPTTNEWTIIFSKENRSWGTYSYDQKEDFLRIKVKPFDGEYNQFLSYEFIERSSNKTKVVLKWDELKVPFTIQVPNSKELYIKSIRNDLRDGARWDSASLVEAVSYCVKNNVNLEEALVWADRAINYRNIGQKTFRTYYEKSKVLTLLGRKTEAEQLLTKAISALAFDANAIYWEGRRLITVTGAGTKEVALRVFKQNEKLFPKNKFIVHLGLAEVYMRLKDHGNAIKHWKIVLKNVPLENQYKLPFYKKQLEQLQKSK